MYKAFIRRGIDLLWIEANAQQAVFEFRTIGNEATVRGQVHVNGDAELTHSSGKVTTRSLDLFTEFQALFTRLQLLYTTQRTSQTDADVVFTDLRVAELLQNEGWVENENITSK